MKGRENWERDLVHAKASTCFNLLRRWNLKGRTNRQVEGFCRVGGYQLGAEVKVWTELNWHLANRFLFIFYFLQNENVSHKIFFILWNKKYIFFRPRACVKPNLWKRPMPYEKQIPPGSLPRRQAQCVRKGQSGPASSPLYGRLRTSEVQPTADPQLSISMMTIKVNILIFIIRRLIYKNKQLTS